MKRKLRNQYASMSPDAYAGFLKLLLTPLDREPRPSPELDAYFDHLSVSEPLPANVKRILGQPTVEAA